MKQTLKSTLIIPAIVLTGVFATSCAGLNFSVMGDGKNPADGRYSVDVEAMSFTQDIASQSRCVQSSDKRLTDRFSYGYSNMAVNQNLSCGVSKHVDLQSKKDEVMICCGKPQKRAL